MNKFLLSAVSVALLLPLTAQASEWTFLAGAKDGYVANPAVSLIAGNLDPDITGADSGTVTGIELSLNCPLLQPPTNRIRQQISYGVYDEDGLKISTIELNPHYIVKVAPGWEVGAGPGLGYVSVESDGFDESAWALQLGASVHYTGMGPLFVGAEARYQVTDELGDTSEEADNTRLALKVGMSF